MLVSLTEMKGVHVSSTTCRFIVFLAYACCWIIARAQVPGRGRGREVENGNFFNAVKKYGNVTIPSAGCFRSTPCVTWNAWQSWAECDIPVPEYTKPRCYNTLKIRLRFCKGNRQCHEAIWANCLHNESCIGEWSTWSQYDTKCDSSCQGSRIRNRTCLVNNVEQPGMCLGSQVGNSTQIEINECSQDDCGKNSLLPIAVLFGMGLPFIMIIVMMVLLLKSRDSDRRLSASRSIRFLESVWGTVREKISSSVTRSSPYNDGSVRETSTNYPTGFQGSVSVVDSFQENIYEYATDPDPNERAQGDTAGPYAIMGPLVDNEDGSSKNFRSQTYDNTYETVRETPKPRGATAFPFSNEQRNHDFGAGQKRLSSLDDNTAHCSRNPRNSETENPYISPTFTRKFQRKRSHTFTEPSLNFSHPQRNAISVSVIADNSDYMIMHSPTTGSFDILKADDQKEKI